MENVRLEIHFVRHAQSAGNIGEAYPQFHADDPPLTETGLLQAKALAGRYPPGFLTAICASTLIRTCQTVQPTAERFDMPVRMLPELREVGTAIGGTALEAVQTLAPAAFDSAARVLPGLAGDSLYGETPEMCAGRADAAVKILLSLYPPGSRILVATHGAFFGFLIRRCLGLSLPEPFGWQVDNCAVTAVALREGKSPLLLCANEISHMSTFNKEAF